MKPDKFTFTFNKNEPVYIIAGGPSLRGFDFSTLKDKQTIVINRGFEVLPEATMLYWTDRRFYEWYKKSIDRFKGYKVTTKISDNLTDDVIIYKKSSDVYNDIVDFLSTGNNSGYGAIALAIKMGAKKINLLGYDMKSEPNSTHWHSGYQTRHNHMIYNKMISNIERLAIYCHKNKIEVINYNMDSKLNCFIKKPLNNI